MTPTPTIFAPLFIAATALFIWSCWKRLSLTALGRPDNRLDNIGQRIGDTLSYAFAQKRVLAKPSGLIHVAIFWCFLVLMVANTEFILHGLFPGLTFTKLPDGIFMPLMQMIDVVSLITLLAVIAAAIRRAVSPPYPEARTFEAFFILFLIATLMLANFGVNAAKISRMQGSTLTLAESIMPISSWFAPYIPSGAGKLVHDLSWWTHALVLLLFMNLLPLSKHFHIITAIPNVFLRRRDNPPLPEREEFNAGNSFGINQVDGYTWKELLDSFSCTECGRCQMACPADQTRKPLNPRGVIGQLKHNLMANGPLLKEGKAATTPLIGEGDASISEEAIWSCTTCGACLQACPVFIEQMPKLIPLRRHLVEMESRFPEELLNLFENMEGRSNPWGIAPTERGKWATQLGERPYEPGRTEYLFYVGCAGSFDARAKQISVATALLLDKAGVSWGMLGKDEKCCGDSLRRLGNEYVFDKLAKENVALFKERGIKKVIVQCPHCLTTLKNDYKQYGIELEVIHHSQLLLHLVQDGRLKLPKQADLGKLVYHDSCYLGRHNGIYDEPREALALATGTEPLEMPRNREDGFCCGAGGGRMWMEEFTGDRINLVRAAEALEQQPDTICTACPYCLTMLDDGIKDLRADKVQVKDIAEIMAEAVLR
ncbi:MAG: (Fe-S)-binding protein [Trichlorobacter sp.]|uniref:(Fe-S)-binding protein n=1 Tax=Trichlorobacter sp. TaxID=2911007 RepID=UPI002562F702|nr:(Fe-S)-binding protein [Trichlorobacter sp.]MDK9717283.1 (Fe-S)-binding protein [Trichlorobacter sp.]